MASTVPAGAVIVGVDGSASATLALGWAATEAAAVRRPLVLVHAGPAPAPAGAGWLEATGVDHRRVCLALKEEARAVLAAAERMVRADHPDLEVVQVVRLGDPREILLETSAQARLLVVGTRGLGPLRHLLLGSVSSALVKHAACPVVVVRPPAGAAGGSGEIAAGVAGDAGDAAVLGLAFEVAAARRLPVHAVHCFWDATRLTGGAARVPPGEPGLDEEWLLLEDALRPHSDAHPEVEVRAELACGMVDEQLVRAGATAGLLVVGHRRKPFLGELVHGSIAPTVAERAACPVAVVPLA